MVAKLIFGSNVQTSRFGVLFWLGIGWIDEVVRVVMLRDQAFGQCFIHSDM